jgi:hypothetical protein
VFKLRLIFSNFISYMLIPSGEHAQMPIFGFSLLLVEAYLVSTGICC